MKRQYMQNGFKLWWVTFSVICPMVKNLQPFEICYDSRKAACTLLLCAVQVWLVGNGQHTNVMRC